MLVVLIFESADFEMARHGGEKDEVFRAQVVEFEGRDGRA